MCPDAHLQRQARRRPRRSAVSGMTVHQRMQLLQTLCTWGRIRICSNQHSSGIHQVGSWATGQLCATCISISRSSNTNARLAWSLSFSSSTRLLPSHAVRRCSQGLLGCLSLCRNPHQSGAVSFYHTCPSGAAAWETARPSGQRQRGIQPRRHASLGQTKVDNLSLHRSLTCPIYSCCTPKTWCRIFCFSWAEHHL